MAPRFEGAGAAVRFGETASDETGGSKAQWIDRLPGTLRRRYPQIKAVVWFDIHEERRWQIGSSTAARNAFRRMAANPYFRTGRRRPTGR